MAATIRIADQTDRHKWDAYIQAQPQALLAHEWYWHDYIPHIFPVIKPIYWIAESAGRVVGIAPFFYRAHFALGRRLVSVPFLNTGGILADTPALRGELWAAVAAWAEEHRVTGIEMRCRANDLGQFAPRAGRTVSIIPLATSEAAAWDAMKSVARNRVRKAEAAGLSVRYGFEDFDGFWRAYEENMRFLGVPVLVRRWFAGLIDRPDTHLLTVHQGGAVVGGMLLLGFKDGVENSWTASTIAARELYCNDLLYWQAIRWAVGTGRRWLDLGRSQAGGGHEKFKEKFGAQTQALPYQELHRHDSTWQAVTQEPEALYHAFTAVWRRLPRVVARATEEYILRQVY